MTTMAMQNRIAQLEQRLTILERAVDLVASEIDHLNDPGPVPRETTFQDMILPRKPGRPKKVPA